MRTLVQSFSLLFIKRAFLFNSLNSHVHIQFLDISTEISLHQKTEHLHQKNLKKTHVHYILAKLFSAVTVLFNKFECN